MEAYKRAIEGKPHLKEDRVIKNAWPTIVFNVIGAYQGKEANLKLSGDEWVRSYINSLTNSLPEGFSKIAGLGMNAISYLLNVYLSLAVSHYTPKMIRWGRDNMLRILLMMYEWSTLQFHPPSRYGFSHMPPNNFHHMIPYNNGMDWSSLITTMMGFNPISRGIYRDKKNKFITDMLAKRLAEQRADMYKASQDMLRVRNAQLTGYNEMLEEQARSRSVDIDMLRSEIDELNDDQHARRHELNQQLLRFEIERAGLQSRLVTQAAENKAHIAKLIKKINNERDRQTNEMIRKYEREIVSKRTVSEAQDYLLREHKVQLQKARRSPMLRRTYQARAKGIETLINLFEASNADKTNEPLNKLINFVIKKSESLVDVLGITYIEGRSTDIDPRVPGRESRITERTIRGWVSRLQQPFIKKLEQDLGIKHDGKKKSVLSISTSGPMLDEIASKAFEVLKQYIDLKVDVITRPPMAP